MAARKKQTSRGRANRVVGELRSEGFPGNGNKFQNGAEDQVVLRELRSGGDLEVPVSAKARGHIAMHKPTQARSHFARIPCNPWVLDARLSLSHLGTDAATIHRGIDRNCSFRAQIRSWLPPAAR